MKIKEYRTIRSFLEDARDIIDLSRSPKELYADDMLLKWNKNPLSEEDLDLLDNIISCIFTVETLIDKLYLEDLPEDEEKKGPEIQLLATDIANNTPSVYDQLRECWSMQDVDNSFCESDLKILHESTDENVLKWAQHEMYKKRILEEEK